MRWLLVLSLPVFVLASCLLVSAWRDRRACRVAHVNGLVLTAISDTAHRAMVKMITSAVVSLMDVMQGASILDLQRHAPEAILLGGLLILTMQDLWTRRTARDIARTRE